MGTARHPQHRRWLGTGRATSWWASGDRSETWHPGVRTLRSDSWRRGNWHASPAWFQPLWLHVCTAPASSWLACLHSAELW